MTGPRKNAGKHEWRFFVEMATNPDRFPVLYNLVLVAARQAGIDSARLPDFLHIEGVRNFDLLGRAGSGIDVRDRRRTQGREERAQLLAPNEADTIRMVEQAVRLGQLTASQVLDDYSHSCAFCGFAPKSIPGNRLFVASHIKPWADSDDAERLDPHNGVAACPTHDAAFDSGLITINGELRVHRSPSLKRSAAADKRRSMRTSATRSLLVCSSRMVPTGPGAPLVEWHHEHVYQGELVS